MTEKRLYLDVHVLQTLPPSNINRDDTGSPKTAYYGGVRRARVSSQAWKRAIRKYFVEHGDEAAVGVRTKDIVRYVADKVRQLDPSYGEADAMQGAEKAINNAGIKTKDHKAKALFFMGDLQARELAGAVLAGKIEKSDMKDLQAALAASPEIDIALFGRMVADAPKLNTDASCQVAHAISTHAVQTEFDYFTAVDDCLPEDQSGAGMLGNIEYNSSTLYRYANIAVHELREQLGGKEASINTCRLFIEAFSNSLPTGKVNTFANQTLPSFLMVTLREDRPVNLVSAFEKPVCSGQGQGYVNASVERLGVEYEKASKIVTRPLENLYLNLTEAPGMEDGLECQTLPELLDQAAQAIGRYLEEEGE